MVLDTGMPKDEQVLVQKDCNIDLDLLIITLYL